MTKIDRKLLTIAERLARLQLMFAELVRDLQASPRRKSAVVAKCIRACSPKLQGASVRFFSGETDVAQKLLDLVSIYLVFAREVMDSDAIEAALGESDFLELSQSGPEDELSQLFDVLKVQIEQLRIETGN